MNFNPLAAMAGRITIAQVEELVEPGELDPAQCICRACSCSARHTGPQDKRIEKRTVARRKEPTDERADDRAAGPATRWPPAPRRR